MGNLNDTAQMTMDLYYQNYKTDEDFFNLQHFVYLSGVAYSKILEDEYKEGRKLAMLEEGFTDVVLQEDWLVEEVVEMKKIGGQPASYYGPLKRPLFAFPHDAYSFGIQNVRPAGETQCNQFIRTSVRESWMDCQLPASSTGFFHVVSNMLVVTNAQCALDKVIIMMVPDITAAAYGNGGGPVPGAKEDMIIRKTLEIILRAREGVVVDMTNNSNPNKALQTEIDAMIKA